GDRGMRSAASGACTSGDAEDQQQDERSTHEGASEGPGTAAGEIHAGVKLCQRQVQVQAAEPCNCVDPLPRQEPPDAVGLAEECLDAWAVLGDQDVLVE